MFILGFKYCKINSKKTELINFILGNAKMAIYISRKNKVEQENDYDILGIFLRLIKSRIQTEFLFYKSVNNIDVFKNVWCFEEAVCSVMNDELVFAHWLL